VIERGLPVAARQIEFRCVGRDALRYCGCVLESAVNRLGGDPPHSARLHVIGQKVGDHAGRAGHRQAGEHDPIRSRNLAAVQTDIAAPCLAPLWKRELMYVCPQISDSMEPRGRSVRDDGAVGVVEASPGGLLGIKLEPSGAQPEMVGLSGAANAIETVRHPLQPAVCRQAGQRRMANSRLLRLTSRDQSPLTLRNLRYPLHRPHDAANYTESRILCSS